MSDKDYIAIKLSSLFFFENQKQKIKEKKCTERSPSGTTLSVSSISTLIVPKQNNVTEDQGDAKVEKIFAQVNEVVCPQPKTFLN